MHFPRSESPPVSRPFHTVEKTFITGNWLLNFQKISKKSWPKIAKNVETHLKTPFSFLNIDSKFKTKIEFRLQFSRSNCPPVCAPFHTVEDWFNLKEAFRRGKINHRMERRRDWGCLNCKRNSIEICFRKTHVLTHICHFWSKINHRMGERRNGGCLNCKRNSSKICFRKAYVFTHIFHFWNKIFHRMDEPRNRGCLNCNRNSNDISSSKTCMLYYICYICYIT